jgi:nitroimidazol reductase NimA-like FMN-containing flavoprotein (pyridoxamine 5'-phosphate oxidase superfamily)
MRESASRTRFRRRPSQGSYDRDVIYGILDAALVAHVGFLVDGLPRVIPTLHARIGDLLYLHGSSAGTMTRALAAAPEVCVTVTLLDELVLARAAFEQNVNYRAVMAFGRPRVISDAEEKLAGLRALTEHLLPGRWEQCRQPKRQELKATTLLAMELSEVTAKLRTGGPTDDEADLALPHWAGIVPRTVTWGPPIADPGVPAGVEAPEVARTYSRQGS